MEEREPIGPANTLQNGGDGGGGYGREAVASLRTAARSSSVGGRRTVQGRVASSGAEAAF